MRYLVELNAPTPCDSATFFQHFFVDNISFCGVPQPGDINGDGVVDVDDLSAVILGWGACPTPPAVCPADVNQTGAVDVDDLLIVIQNWG